MRVAAEDAPVSREPLSLQTTLLWTIFGGALCLHRLYLNYWEFFEGDFPVDKLRLFTLNYLFVGWIMDLFQYHTVYLAAMAAHARGAGQEALQHIKNKALKAKEKASSACTIL